MSTPRANDLRQGILAGLAAYFVWGLVPIFFKQLGGLDAMEIIAHRVVWSLVIMAGVLYWGGGFAQVGLSVRDPRRLARVALGSLLVAANWLIFVYGINTGQILATSLGYFILPLFNIALGVLFLRERLRGLQWLAVAFAAAGVLAETYRIGELPWIALSLALTFGVYGLLRKQLAMDAASGLFLETACITPFAVAYLVWLHASGAGHFGEFIGQSLLLIASGPVTAIPLLLFAISARRVPLSMMGFMQYLAPTLSLLVGVVLYHEPFDLTRALGFGAIWLGIAVYSFDMWRNARPTQS
jgi:chloramphenicol-sensitive protein RarD